MEAIKVIASREELRWCYDYIMSPLEEGEIYFISSSIRKKKLTDEQKKIIPHNEMFNKVQIIHDTWESFYRGFRKLEVPIDAYFPEEAESFIQDTIVSYLNICPIDCLAAVGDQITYLNETLYAMSRASFKSSDNARRDCLQKIVHSFSNCQSLFARNFGHRTWIDIDVDYDNVLPVYQGIKYITDTEFGPDNHIDIKTGGGLHILIRKSCLHDDIRKVFNKISLACSGKASEIIINKNNMCAAPGTYQYGKMVYVLNKEDIITKLHC